MSDDANAVNDDDFLNAEPEQDQSTEQPEKSESEASQEGEQDSNKETEKENKEEKKDDKPEGDEPKKPSSRSQRYQKKIARQDERIGSLETENAELQRQLAELQGKQEVKELDPDDFDSYQDFLDAAAQQASELKQRKEKAPRQTGNQEQVFKEALADVTGDFDEARSKYKDFEELVIKNEELQITPDMVICLADCEEPAELAYYLGQHPKVAEKLAGMNQRAIARELGKIEANLHKAPPKKQSKAPEPMGSIAGKGKQTATEKVSSDPDDEIL